LSILVAVGAGAAIAVWRMRMHAASPPGAPENSAPVTWTPVTAQTLAHGRFKHLTVYSPHGAPRGFVLYLSGADGWTAARAERGQALAALGAMVVGIDTRELTSSLEDDGASCVFPDGDLENLSHFVQAYYHLPTYLSPILTGEAAGATLAYATLVQAPANTFAGAVSVGFCPGLAMRKPLCKGSGVEFTPRADGVEFLPSPHLTDPWVVLGGAAAGDAKATGLACSSDAVTRFVAQMPAARQLAAPPTAVTGGAWPPAYAAEFDTLLGRFAPTAAAIPDALKDLPIVAVPAHSAAAAAPGAAAPGAAASGAAGPPEVTDTFAIMLSGDGGWAGLDKEVAAALADQNIPVVGLDSLRYFWSPRTPDGLAADLDRMIGVYRQLLGRQRVMVIGYSQGADVLPFAINRLRPSLRAQVVLAAVMGMSEHALFEFHVSSWIADDDSGPPTLPEVQRITGMKVLCIYGDQEDDSLCPKLDAGKVTVVKLKGGHHFDGNYAGLAKTILDAAPP
jgi:type IV secretory pathway VirJ component